MTYQRRTTVNEETTPHLAAEAPVDRGPLPQAEHSVAHTRHTVYDPYEARRHTLYRWTQDIYLFLGVIEGLIAVRFALSLLGANPAAAFADFIYDVTDPLVAPFVGVFGTPQVGESLFEPHSLLAMVVYALLAWLLVKILWVTMGETRTAVTRSTVHQHDEV